MTAGENAIRDELASRLSLIEPGLQHIASNFHLQNSHRADGFVDILARDSTGVFVVVELKKSDSTARQALHEVGKYVDLLSRDRGLSSDQVRAIVISTDWHELLVPFSYYVHQSRFDLKGFTLEIADDGLTPIRASPISVLPPSRARILTASQRRIDGTNGEDLAAAWGGVKDRLHVLDVPDYVALHISDGDEGKMIVLVLGTISSDEARVPMGEVLLRESSFDVEDLELIPTEQLVLLGMEYEGHPLGVCYPEKVGALLEGHGWQLDVLERAGVFNDTDLFPDAEVLEACQGWTGGLSVAHFSGRARTSNSTQWSKFRGSISMVIADSPGWVAPTRLWLDEVQAAAPQWDISVNVYDPHDFLQALLHGYKTQRWHELVPFFSLAVEAPNNAGFGLFGYLRWDGTTVNLVDGLRRGYKNIGEWGDLRAFDAQAEGNARLLEAWHLRYELTEKYAVQTLPQVLSELNDGLVRSDTTEEEFGEGLFGPLMMFEFLEAHEAQLDELVDYLKRHVVIDAGSATQMLMFNAGQDSDWY